MYRAISWLALQKNVSPKDRESLSRLASEARMELHPPLPGSPIPYTLIVDGQDIASELRLPDVEKQVSIVSRVRGVRDALIAEQRRLAEGGDIVMAGRDIGTVVLPNADLKIYLEASPQVRSERRFQEIKDKGHIRSQVQVLAELIERDRIDSERALSPLKPAEDAVIIRTDDLNLEQVVARVLELTGNN
jgi:cytidylate kinase